MSLFKIQKNIKSIFGNKIQMDVSPAKWDKNIIKITIFIPKTMTVNETILKIDELDKICDYDNNIIVDTFYL